MSRCVVVKLPRTPDKPHLFQTWRAIGQWCCSDGRTTALGMGPRDAWLMWREKRDDAHRAARASAGY